MTIYLAGAMETYGDSDYAGKWRSDCNEWFKNNCENVRCISPNDYYNYSHNTAKTGLEIMRFDLHKVTTADVILVNMNHIRKSIGTSDEVLCAWMLHKPIIGFVDEEVEGQELEDLVHPWKNWQATRIETGKDSMLNAMIYIKDFYLN